jgi:hypothetical protein
MVTKAERKAQRRAAMDAAYREQLAKATPYQGGGSGRSGRRRTMRKVQK